MAHVCQHLASAARRDPHRRLTTCEGRNQTAGEFAARVAALAAALVADYGLKPGDRVALAAMNTDRHFEALLAVLAAGGLLAPLNWRWSLEDAVVAIAPCTPRIVIVDEPCQRFAAVAKNVASIEHAIALGAGDFAQPLQGAAAVDDLVARHAGAALPLRAPDNNAAVLCFTSGTTAAPKAAVLTHAAFHVQSLVKAALGYCAADVFYHAAPICHIGGLSSAFAVLMAGGTHVFPTRFEPSQMQRDLEQHQVSSFIAVPAMLTALWQAAGPQRAFPHVRRMLVGGGTPTAAMMDNTRRMLPSASIRLSYAMTEACSTMTLRSVAEPGAALQPQQQRRQGTAAWAESVPEERDLASAVCVGWPAPGVEIDIELVRGLGPGEGIVRTRGPHTMLGYWSEGGAALRAQPDRWLSTGDIGRLDSAGRLWLSGRSNDTIRTGSETVHASEVERCLQLHPEVLAAAVVGLPHQRLDQQVAALVQVAEPQAHSPAAWQELLRGFCKDNGLSGYKLPGVVCCQAAPLPANSNGKLLKREACGVILQKLQRATPPPTAAVAAAPRSRL